MNLTIKGIGLILFFVIVGIASIFITIYGIGNVIVRGIWAILEGNK